MAFHNSQMTEKDIHVTWFIDVIVEVYFEVLHLHCMRIFNCKRGNGGFLQYHYNNVSQMKTK